MAFKGSTKIGARLRTGLTDKFLKDLFEDYEKHGAGAITIMRMEEPAKYCQMIAAFLPKEIEITHDNQLANLSDERLDDIIDALRRGIATAALRVVSRENATIDGEQTKLLSAVSEATRVLRSGQDLSGTEPPGGES